MFLKYLLLLLLPASPLSAGRINFVYPQEGAYLPQVQKTFVFGNISPSTSSLLINGFKVPVHPNGGFIAYLPVAGGDFIFAGALDDGTTAQRSVKVRQPAPEPSSSTLRLEFTSHTSDTELVAGDYLRVAASGTPGHEAVFSLEEVAKDIPMQEAPQGSGRYYGSLRAGKPLPGGGVLTARFKSGLFARGAAARAKGRIRILEKPVLVETSTDAVVLKNATDGGYIMFLPAGVKLVSDGASNGYRRLDLAGQEAWVDSSKVRPAAAPPYPFGHGSETGVIRLSRTSAGSSAAITLYDRLPYQAETTPWGLRLTLFYANLHTNWVVYDAADELVKNVSFRQAGTGRVEIDFETEPGELWGYEVSYPEGSSLMQVDLRARPKPSRAWPRPLSGLTVVVDPGHSAYYKCPDDKRVPMKDVPYQAMPAGCWLDGAVGPKETFEVNVNLEISKRLKARLESLGAAVRLTRSGDENVELADRTRLAKALGGDIFISVHNNAIGDGEDPFGKPRGFSVYYYHRHSRRLAEAVHGAFARNVALPDEGLRYGDYYVARMTWMPAALLENAYMILPAQEELLNDAAFQEKLADTVSEGLLNLFGVPGRKAGRKR